MQFGPPQCGVALDLGNVKRFGCVSIDSQRNIWATDISKTSVFMFTQDQVQPWLRSYAEEQRVNDLGAVKPLTTLDTGDKVVGFAHGAAPWTWVVSTFGVLLIHAASGEVSTRHRLGVTITAFDLYRPNTLLLAAQTDEEDVHEVLSLTYAMPSGDGTANEVVTAKGKGLFRIRDTITCVCLGTFQDDGREQHVSLLSMGSESLNRGDHSVYLFTITQRGVVEVWDIASGCTCVDFGELSFDVESVGMPTCATVVGRSLWVGTHFGPVVVFDLECVDPRQPALSQAHILRHHKSSVKTLLPMTLGHRVWSCCEDGVVAVWSVARKKPCGVFDVQQVPMMIMTTSPKQLLTNVWGISVTGTIKCWEVREEMLVTAATLGEGRPERTGVDSEAERFVGDLCDVLTNRKQSCTVPIHLDDRLPDARFLPDALISLSECRDMIFESFRELQWESSSLSEDVRLLIKYARAQHRAHRRAEEVAQRLNSLTPSFPIPSAITDSIDRLLSAAECVLEEVAERGVLQAPNHSQSQSVQQSKPTQPNQSLDDSLPPEAAQLSEHIFETQLRALQENYDAERAEKAALKSQLAQLERDVERHVSEQQTLEERNDGLFTEVERLKKVLSQTKKRLQQEEQNHAAERQEQERSQEALQSELQTCKQALTDVQQKLSLAVAASPARDQSDLLLQGANRAIRDLVSLLRQSSKAHKNVKEAAHDVLQELDDAKQAAERTEVTHKALLASLQAERLAVADMVSSLRQYVSQARGAQVDSNAVLARLAPLESLLRDRRADNKQRRQPTRLTL